MRIVAVTHKEVVTAILGTSAGLAGFALVFVGVILAAATFNPGTKRTIVAKALAPGRAVLGSFGIGVACLTVSIVWFLVPRSYLYWLAVALFFAQVGSLAATTAWVARRALWG